MCPILREEQKKLYTTSFKSRVLLGGGFWVFWWGFFGMYLGSWCCGDVSDMGRAEFWLSIFQDRHLMLHNVWQSCWAKADKRQILRQRDETLHRMNQMNTGKWLSLSTYNGFRCLPNCSSSQQLPLHLLLPGRHSDAQEKASGSCLHHPALPGLSMPQTCFNSSANPLINGNFLLGQFCHWSIFSHFHSPPLAPDNLNYFKLVTPEIHLGASFLQYVDWIYIIVI